MSAAGSPGRYIRCLHRIENSRFLTVRDVTVRDVTGARNRDVSRVGVWGLSRSWLRGDPSTANLDRARGRTAEWLQRRHRLQRFQRGEITSDFLEQFNHEIGVLLWNARKRLPARPGHQVPYVIDQRPPLRLEIKTAGPAISRIVTSLQPPVGLEAVKGSHESHRLEIRQLR